jgi:two-component system chemotaxis sensor kinase CheA
MVPVRQTFNKMNRIVRDIAKKVGKEVDFVVQGEETEIDRTIAEKIGDPLVHMVRNAVDHGLEKNAEERLRAGKSTEGRVELKAYHKAGSVWIDVADDGRGLDREKLIKKALETGFLRSGQNISDEEADQLIFMPGLSTAEKVTDVSGRGVGMDVVKKNIQEIHGNIEIESKKGKGTRFKIRIPNTLAIIEGMLIVVGQERYVIPAQSIVRAVNARETLMIRNPSGRGRMVEVNNETLPLIYLGHFYEIPEAKLSLQDTIVLIVEDNNRKLALVVDKIVRKQQFVIKPLGEDMKNVPGIVGGTILPDGLVGLIIDIGLLLQDASTNHSNEHNQNLSA